MDNEEHYENIDSVDSSSTNFLYEANTAHSNNNDLGDHLQDLYNFGNQTRNPDQDTFGVQANRLLTLPNTANCKDVKPLGPCKTAVEPFCHVKLDSLKKLKDSTKKLLCLVEEIESKTHSKHLFPSTCQLTDLIKPLPNANDLPSVSDIVGAKAIKRLESQAKTLDAIYIEDEEDNCTVYKRLTRKCNCLNQHEYNDFIIHFNEDTKYFTSTNGEIIKNIRILKKFLYIDGVYAKRALMFLNEGLRESSHTEKVEITQACAYADICNVFEDQSIVIVCISWPCKYENYGDAATQAQAASFLFKLAQLEEGRRYLKFSSKITNDLKKVIRKRASNLEFETLESLNVILNLMHPPLPQHLNVTYYCKPVDEGFGHKTVTALLQYRQYMTLDEVFTHLDLLHNLSNNDSGKKELTTFLPAVLNLFKRLLIEYDNSEMNIIVTNILNNIVSRNMVKEPELPKTVIVADTATEPVQMKNETIQIPVKKNNQKKGNKIKLGHGISPFKQTAQSFKRKELEPSSSLSKSKKFTKGNIESRKTVIIVPIEE